MDVLLTVFLFCSTICFLIMGIIWTKKIYGNFLLKCFLIMSGLIGLILTLSRFGYIIKL